ncbi:CoA-binding protein [Bacteroidota bacterium]
MKETIELFMQDKHIAVAGVSRSKGKWGNALMKELAKKDIHVYPVNPHADEIEGVKCYRDLKSLPDEVKSLVIATKPAATEELLKDCKEAGIERVWMQKGAGKGSASEESIQYCKENNLAYVYGVCPMMYFGGGMHGFHRWIRKAVGKMPAELVD